MKESTALVQGNVHGREEEERVPAKIRYETAV